MVILGIDPGLAKVGYGIIRFKKDKLSLIKAGCLKTSSKIPFGERLKIIYKEIKKIIKKYKPNFVILEELFFAKNVKTAFKVGQVMGIINLAVQEEKIPVFQITPLQAKMALTGYGRASKKQVQKMVQTLLNLKNLPKPKDTSDALALAISSIRMINKKYEI
jgi:crossover junction endodeoxyribonuclease RuvC